LSRVDLNCFDGVRKKDERIPVNQQVGVASLLADVVLSPEDERALHLHFVAGRRNGTVLAGQRKQVRHER
jgi:predicted DNA-binding protein with PD1-like motif